MNLGKKNIMLLSGFLLVLIVCYKIPVKQTIKLKNEREKLNQERVLTMNLPNTVGTLKTEEQYLDSLLLKYEFASEKSFQSNLLHTITQFSKTHKLTIVTFEEPHVFFKDKTTIKTYSFTIRGDYNGILKLLHEIEQTKKMGPILSVNYEKKKNYRTNRNYLEAKVLLQRLSN